MSGQITVCLDGTRYRYSRFDVGDVVEWEEWCGPQVVLGVTVYPASEYVFAYWLTPSSSNSKEIGHDIPEDELDIYLKKT